MKKSYIRLIIFEISFIAILLFDTLKTKIFVRNNFLLFLLISLYIFKLILGLEKDRHRYVKDIIIQVISFMLVFFILYYLSGIKIGFYKNENFYTLYGLKTFIIPVVVKTILIEILRYVTIIKSENSKGLITLNIVMFLIIDFINYFSYLTTGSFYNVFIFIIAILFPLISKNIVASKMTIKFGYKPFLTYALIINLYGYLLPIIPNYSQYLNSIVLFILPILLLGKIKINLDKFEDKEISRNKKNNKLSLYIIPTIIVIITVYFTSGYFKYYAVAIGSGSMEPSINKGDVVVINKKFKEVKLKTGQIIAFKHNNVIIVHRIKKILRSNNKNYYYTKGDANSDIDSNYVLKDDIIGVVNLKIPYIGIPTILLSEI